MLATNQVKPVSTSPSTTSSTASSSRRNTHSEICLEPPTHPRLQTPDSRLQRLEAPGRLSRLLRLQLRTPRSRLTTRYSFQ